MSLNEKSPRYLVSMCSVIRVFQKMRPTTLYLHIGYPKTGTTSIQVYLHKHRQQLLKQGVLYPETGILWKAHHPFAGAYQSRDTRLDWLQTNDAIDYVQKLREEISATTPQKVFISSEAFVCTEEIEKLKCQLEPLAEEVKIVCFLRRQDLWTESAFVQRYKTARIPYDFHRHVRDGECVDYDAFLQTWESAFGLSAVKLCLMDKGVGVADAIDPVIRLLDVDPENCPKLTEKMNTRLALDALHLSHMVHARANSKRKDLLIADLTQYSRQPNRFTNYTFFAPGERQAYMLAFEEDNRKIAQRYFNRDALFSPPEDISSLVYVDTRTDPKDITDALAYIFEKNGLYEG